MGDVAPEVKVGDTAPDFTLKDQDQKDVKLSDYKGKKNVVLAFYPLDWSPVCTGENKCLTDDFPKFGSANAELFGISTDSFFSHKAWADSLELKHRLLSDFNREVVKKYGLYFEPLNCGKRATVIVDKNGKVAYVKVQEIKTARDDKDILAALEKLK
jgi:peroxiredoxin